MSVDILYTNNEKQDFPAVLWLRLQASTAGGVGSIPGQGTKIPHDTWLSQKKKKKKKTDMPAIL